MSVVWQALKSFDMHKAR